MNSLPAAIPNHCRSPFQPIRYRSDKLNLNYPPDIAAHLQAHKTPTQTHSAKELQFCRHTSRKNLEIKDEHENGNERTM